MGKATKQSLSTNTMLLMSPVRGNRLRLLRLSLLCQSNSVTRKEIASPIPPASGWVRNDGLPWGKGLRDIRAPPECPATPLYSFAYVIARNGSRVREK
jgi:hypothetical protein